MPDRIGTQMTIAKVPNVVVRDLRDPSNPYYRIVMVPGLLEGSFTG